MDNIQKKINTDQSTSNVTALNTQSGSIKDYTENIIVEVQPVNVNIAPNIMNNRTAMQVKGPITLPPFRAIYSHSNNSNISNVINCEEIEKTRPEPAMPALLLQAIKDISSAPSLSTIQKKQVKFKSSQSKQSETDNVKNYSANNSNFNMIRSSFKRTCKKRTIPPKKVLIQKPFDTNADIQNLMSDFELNNWSLPDNSASTERVQEIREPSELGTKQMQNEGVLNLESNSISNASQSSFAQMNPLPNSFNAYPLSFSYPGRTIPLRPDDYKGNNPKVLQCRRQDIRFQHYLAGETLSLEEERSEVVAAIAPAGPFIEETWGNRLKAFPYHDGIATNIAVQVDCYKLPISDYWNIPSEFLCQIRCVNLRGIADLGVYNAVCGMLTNYVRFLNVFPNVCQLELPETFDSELPLEILVRLERLRLGSFYSKKLPVLTNLRDLTLGWGYFRELLSLPQLQYLQVGPCFEGAVTPDKFPNLQTFIDGQGNTYCPQQLWNNRG